ncbi:MAG: hypothetical protein HY246_05685, partial [Proteobacteria bacterium]|nr:hypothetical protein [Pseudomonadota bacterium]
MSNFAAPRFAPDALYAKQHRAIFAPSRYSLIEASTKAGKTFGCLVWLHAQAEEGGPGRHYWWVAPIYAQAKIAFRRLKSYLPRGGFKASLTEQTITLANGTMLWFKGADRPDSLYGEDVVAAVIDEASRVKAESWHAVRSTLTATRGPLRIVGNVKGRRNWFYQLARKAEAGAPDMEFHRLVAADAVAAGVLSADEVADARGQLPAAVFRELYLAEASDDAGNPFGFAAIGAAVAALSKEAPVAWGWDLGKSVDWTVGIALDAAGRVCRCARLQESWMDTIDRIRQCTGDAPAL